MKQSVKDPLWLLPDDWGRTGLTAGLVAGSGVYLPEQSEPLIWGAYFLVAALRLASLMVFFFSSSTTG